jgi:hypothetical protein
MMVKLPEEYSDACGYFKENGYDGGKETFVVKKLSRVGGDGTV